MKGKKEYIIVILLIIGLGVFIWRDRTDQVHYQLPDIQPLESSEISRIELEKGNATVRIEKTGQEWVVHPGQFPAQKGKVQRALQAVADLQLTALASESGHYQRYGLDQNSAVHARAYTDQKQVRALYVGKTASSAGNTYVRLPDYPAVYLAQSNLRVALDRDKNSFVDKTVLSFSSADIEKIQIVANNDQLQLSRRQRETADQNATASPSSVSNWRDASGGQADKETIDGLLNRLAGLQCQRFMEDKTADDFPEPSTHIVLQNDDKLELKLFSGELPEEEGTVAVSSQSEYPFVLSSFNSQQVVKKVNALLSENPDKSPEASSGEGE